jgi:hypothetical protein
MKNAAFYTMVIGATALLTLQPSCPIAQTSARQDTASVIKQNLGGPRIGLICAPGNSKVRQDLRNHDMGGTLSQFGWQFEYVVTPKTKGASFAVEFLGLVAGVEYGKFVPTANLIMGVRSSNGFEIGVGPTLMPWKAALSVTVGKSFNCYEMSIPINLIYTNNPDGSLLSLVLGYAI